MSRTAAIIVVMILANGPAAVLCHALCGPMADVMKACDHDGAGAVQIAAVGGCCDDMVAVAPPSRCPATRSDTSFPDGGVVMPVLRDPFVPADAADRYGYEGRRGRSLDHRPLPTVLRL